MLGNGYVIRWRAIGALGIFSSSFCMAESNCTVQSIQAVAPKDTTIVSADLLTAPISHCKIEGYVTTTNPGPNQVNFRLQLPDKAQWAKRYYFIGMGGTAGYVPTDSQSPLGNPLLRGFAVAGTDTGHQYGSLDWSFLGRNPAKALDHERRGGHVTAVATQQITRAYYDTEKFYRYHSGCSAGGRMGLEAITNYPQDYDGALIGEPAPGPDLGTDTTMLAMIHLSQVLNRVPGAFLTPAKLQMVDAKVTEHCDALDGVRDGIVWQHEGCSFDFKQLLCKSGDGPNCITPAELGSIEAIAAGPSTPNAKIKDGFPITNMSTWSLFIGSVPPPWPKTMSNVRADRGLPAVSVGYAIADTGARAFLGSNFDSLKDFDFNNQKQVDDFLAAARKIGYGAPFSPDLTKFEQNGGKVIFWNGVSSPCCLDQDLIAYYKAAAEKSGGMHKLQKYARLYKVPAIGHCGGGTGPQDTPDRLLEALIAWVEKGAIPGRVVSHRGAEAIPLFASSSHKGSPSAVVAPDDSARDFLLCPYPTIAKFDAVRAENPATVNDATNWSCQ